jgi:urease accessory protein
VTAALLTLADSRLPAGGHAHSGGVEQAITAGVVNDPASLETFLRRRLQTAGAVAAGLAAAACRAVGDLDPVASLLALDAEADARTPSPALRAASRQQGRGLARVGGRAWPHPVWSALPAQPHHPLALGVAAAAGGLSAPAAASAAAYLAVSGPATAAQRLLAMDPITVAVVSTRLTREVDEVAAAAAAATATGGLPAAADPLLDLFAEVHLARKDRFFAS